MSRSRIEAAPIEEGVVAALNHDGEGWWGNNVGVSGSLGCENIGVDRVG